jgi:hypothetical protein
MPSRIDPGTAKDLAFWSVKAACGIVRASWQRHAMEGSGWVAFHAWDAPAADLILGGNFVAFRCAGFARVATGLAFNDLGEVVAFLLAVVAKHLDHFGKMGGMLGIDRGKGCKRATTGNKLEGRIRALGHACVFHGEHA